MESKQSRILIVEDEAIVALDMEERLSRAGFTVVGTVATGEDAVRVFRDRLPDVVIMDIQLAGKMDGIDAAAHIQAERRVPVIYLTAFSDRQSLERVKRTNFYGYLLKPFQERELLVTIELAQDKHAILCELDDYRRLLETTLTHVSDGVLRTDSRGKVTYMNAAAGRLTGWTAEDAAGRPVDEVFRTSRMLPRPDTPRTWGTLTSREGDRTFIECGESTVHDGDASENGTVIVFRDITLEKRYQEYLTSAVDMAEANARSLLSFTAEFGSSVREPAAEISRLSRELVGESSGAPDMSIENISGIAGDIVELADSVELALGGEDPKAGAADTEFDVVDTAFKSVDELCARAHQKGVGIYVLYPSGLERRATGDEVRFSRVVRNLLWWTIDRTNEGEVTVTVRPAENAEKSPAYEVLVHGSCDGAFSASVANPHSHRATFESSPATEDTRIAVCRRIVGALGGTLRVEEIPGDSTETIATIPVVRAEGSGKQRIAGMEKISVAVVSSSGAFVESVSSHLVAWGATVEAYWDTDRFFAETRRWRSSRVHVITQEDMYYPARDKFLAATAPATCIIAVRPSSSRSRDDEVTGKIRTLAEPVRPERLRELLEQTAATGS